MRAVVLETRGREAAVLVNDGTVRVAHGKYSVGDIIDYRAVSLARRWVAAAAAMVALIGASAGLWIDNRYVAYAEVSLDVNPSIVFTLNKRDRVLDVRAANEDAEDIVERLEQEGVRFATLSDAVDGTMALLEDDGYLDEETEDYVLFNVSADDETRQTRLADAVQAAMERIAERDSTLEYRINRSDRDTAREARDNGMSAGRYAAWTRAGEGAEEAPRMEEYAEKPVREILGHEPEGGAMDVPAPEAPGEGIPDSIAPQGPNEVPEIDGGRPPKDEGEPAERPEPNPDEQQAPETPASEGQRDLPSGGKTDGVEPPEPSAGTGQSETSAVEPPELSAGSTDDAEQPAERAEGAPDLSGARNGSEPPESGQAPPAGDDSGRGPTTEDRRQSPSQGRGQGSPDGEMSPPNKP